MKSFDFLSQRILAIGIALSAVLLSGSLFVFSIQPLVAEPVPMSTSAVQVGTVPANYAVVGTGEAAYVIKFENDQPNRVWQIDQGGWRFHPMK